LWVARPFGLAEMLPGKTVSPTSRSWRPCRRSFLAPGHRAPGRGRATTAAPTPDDDLPVVQEPHDPTPNPTSITDRVRPNPTARPA
jgi:hypothetical protein